METSHIVSKSSTITLEAELAQVFPLFGPMREKDWAEGWDPVLLSGDPGRVEERMVFRTVSGHPEDPGPATWIVSKYDPERASIEYTVFTRTRIWWISIQCQSAPRQAATDATVQYTYLGLDEAANRLNREALDRMFRHDLKDWQQAINHYLRTGTALRQTHGSHHHG